MSTYANAYVGYLTTHEEYQLPHDEAAYTLLGPFTFADAQTVAGRMAQRLSTGHASVGRLPAAVPHRVLADRPYALAR